MKSVINKCSRNGNIFARAAKVATDEALKRELNSVAVVYKEILSDLWLEMDSFANAIRKKAQEENSNEIKEYIKAQRTLVGSNMDLIKENKHLKELLAKNDK